MNIFKLVFAIIGLLCLVSMFLVNAPAIIYDYVIISLGVCALLFLAIAVIFEKIEKIQKAIKGIK